MPVDAPGWPAPGWWPAPPGRRPVPGSPPRRGGGEAAGGAGRCTWLAGAGMVDSSTRSKACPWIATTAGRWRGCRRCRSMHLAGWRRDGGQLHQVKACNGLAGAGVCTNPKRDTPNTGARSLITPFRDTATPRIRHTQNTVFREMRKSCLISVHLSRRVPARMAICPGCLYMLSH